MKTILFVITAVAVIFGAYFLLFEYTPSDKASDRSTLDDSSLGGAQSLEEQNQNEEATTTDDMMVEENVEDDSVTIIGQSVGGHDIEAYHFGEGNSELLLVSGIHGGYEWNTVLLAYEMIDYFESNEDSIPNDLRVTVIPVLNPDGLMKTTGKTSRFSVADVPTAEGATVPGRFNNNEVDLNRNFDCDWQTNAKWQDKSVSGGTEVFSEPESIAVKEYIETNEPTAAVVYYSKAGGVFASNCHDGVLAETLELTSVYSEASGYTSFKEFDFYDITGDMVNWLAKIRIPAISVLLTTHEDTEWSKNKAGLEALLDYLSETE